MEKNTESVDPELDIRSDQFNSLKALLTPDFRTTSKQPKVIYQNMAALESAINRFGIKNLNKRNKKESGEKRPQAMIIQEPSIKRRFQEHQMALKTSIKGTKRHERNLLKQINENTCGPLSALRRYVAGKIRVRVIVRREHGIKGYLDGLLECYDRYWNLLLSEVIECYIRRKTKYTEQKIANLPENSIHCGRTLAALGIQMPVRKIVRNINRKNIEISRILPQTFIRGEHVVMVYAIEKTMDT